MTFYVKYGHFLCSYGAINNQCRGTRKIIYRQKGASAMKQTIAVIIIALFVMWEEERLGI